MDPAQQKEEVKENALAKGFTVVDLATVMTTHLSDVIRRHAHELVGRQEVQQLLDTLKTSHPKVVEELVPESHRETYTDVATVGAMLGFAVMMTLDVALG